ncbi:MAG: DUF4093 domain-containing protein [Firmicutes bacterium]|nr:DUF4093 domain-containing protein [Bacillota bacterium]
MAEVYKDAAVACEAPADTKPKIAETIVVEGRDDTINLKRAVDCFTIETHGFGIRQETMELIRKAYETTGIIIFTDPDHSGEEIRRRLTKSFPLAKQAYIMRADAMKAGDVGVENAKPRVIVEALQKCRALVSADGTEDAETGSLGGLVDAKSSNDDGALSMEDIYAAGLSGAADSRLRRELVGRRLGIGYANAAGFLRKLRGFRITKEEFYEAVRAVDDQGTQR